MRKALDALLAGAVDSGVVPGVAAVVATRDETIYEGASGYIDPWGRRPVTADTLFRLASMTKLVTAVAVMQIVENGLAGLDDPVAAILPEYADVPVLKGFEGDTPILRPASRSATVRELVSHTSGLSYEVWNPDILRFDQVTGTPGIASGLRTTLRNPLVGDPGSCVEYGTGFDWGGLVVEAVTGMPLDAYYDTAILAPLGMEQTSVTLAPGDAERCGPVLTRAADGTFAATDIGYPQQPEFCTGGGCLYSTAGDYLRLQRALLNGGALDGRRILQPESVAAMFANQIGSLEVGVLRSVMPALSADAYIGAGGKWGIGLCLDSPHGPGLRRRGSGGWCGIYNTYFWIDQAAGLAAAIYTQYVPFYDEPIVALASSFEHAVYTHAAP